MVAIAGNSRSLGKVIEVDGFVGSHDAPPVYTNDYARIILKLEGDGDGTSASDRSRNGETATHAVGEADTSQDDSEG